MPSALARSDFAPRRGILKRVTAHVLAASRKSGILFDMSQVEKLYEHILLRRSDANVSFDALRRLLRNLGFDERIRGDHHILGVCT